jgi:D-cysteine desulfhydrase
LARAADSPPRLALARLPTPLEPLDRLSAEIGGPRIWIKRDDLTDTIASGNKIRKLEFAIARALDEGCDTLLTCGGLQSNHCRTTALLGARLGLHVELLLRGVPDGLADGNYFLDLLLGARTHCYPRPRYQSELPQLLVTHTLRLRSEGRLPYVIPTGASDGTGVWGYVNASEELARDFAAAGIEPRHLVCASGSGGTQAGLTAGLHRHVPGIAVTGIAVCDDAAWFQKKVREDIAEWKTRYGVAIDIDALAVRTLDAYIGPGYARALPAVYASIARVARLEGIVLDPVYTGKAFHGMLQELRAGRLREANDIVFLHTGGVFGLMAQRGELLEAQGLEPRRPAV